MAGDAAPTVVLRNNTRWWMAGFYFLFAAGCLAVLLLGPRNSKSIICAVGASAFALLGVRASRASILIDADGVTARADRFTKHVPWPDIERFELRSNAHGTGLGAWRHDGTWVRLMDRAGVDANYWYGNTVTLLQEQLHQHRPS